MFVSLEKFEDLGKTHCNWNWRVNFYVDMLEFSKIRREEKKLKGLVPRYGTNQCFRAGLHLKFFGSQIEK